MRLDLIDVSLCERGFAGLERFAIAPTSTVFYLPARDAILTHPIPTFLRVETLWWRAHITEGAVNGEPTANRSD